MTQDTKEVDRQLLQRSTVRQFEPRTAPIILWVAAAADEAPPWWSVSRDNYLRKFWPTEPFLAGAIYSIATRNASFRYELDGPERQVARVQDMLSQSDLGNGWQSLIMKVTTDLLTQDNGAFIELIRPARARTRKGWVDVARLRNRHGDPAWVTAEGRVVDDKAVQDMPTEAVIGLAHLDAQRCQRTGDPDYPVVYTDIKGTQHKLSWWQVLTLEDMPSPQEERNGIGYCAVSRALRLAQILRDTQIYKGEKVSGRFTRRMILTNVDPESVQDAINQAEEHADNLGLTRYIQPIMAATVDPNATPVAVPIDLASLPDSFDEETSNRWYIAGLAMCLGVDYGFLAPLPGGNLGTASQALVQAQQARGKSSEMFMKLLEHKLNFGGVLPASVQFEFSEIDEQERGVTDAGAKLRADTRKVRIDSGEITPLVARQIAEDEGDLKPEYLAVMGEEDVTQDVTVGDTDDVGAEQDAEQNVVQQEAAPQVAPAKPQAPTEPGAAAAKWLDVDLALKQAAANYAAGKIDADTLAEFAIEQAIERRASGG